MSDTNEEGARGSATRKDADTGSDDGTRLVGINAPLTDPAYQAPAPPSASRDRLWGLRFTPNPWFSLGIHVDHKGPYIDLHLPWLMIRVGWVYDSIAVTKCPCGRPNSWAWGWKGKL